MQSSMFTAVGMLFAIGMDGMNYLFVCVTVHVLTAFLV
jgi:hypothetical protein